MRAVRIGLACLALLAGACSLSLDGDHFLGGGSDGGPGSPPDARAPDRPGPDAAVREDDPPATCGESCGDGDCELTCPDRPCDCQLDCDATADTCKPTCEHHDCAIDCRQTGKCEARCKYSNCTIDCTNARECNHVKCEGGSGCLLDCSGAERCEYDACDGEVTSCPGGLLACNRDCP